MTGQPQSVASAYARVDLESQAMGASPHQLIDMLFDGVQVALRKANRGIERGDRAAKSQALTKAIELIASGLRAALDMETGGDFAQDLDALYDYMIRTLMRANLRNDAALVDEVAQLLGEIGEAWKQIAP